MDRSGRSRYVLPAAVLLLAVAGIVRIQQKAVTLLLLSSSSTDINNHRATATRLARRRLAEPAAQNDFTKDPRSIETKAQGVGAAQQRSISASSPGGKSEFTAKQPRKIVNCGTWWTGSVNLLFPGWKGQHIPLPVGGGKDIRELIEQYDLNENDLLFGHLHKAETCISGGVFNFPGKQLWYNPEPEDELPPSPHRPDEPPMPSTNGIMSPERRAQIHNYLPPSDKIYVIGPHEDTPRSIQMLAGMPYFFKGHRDRPDNMAKLTDPTKRPRNTGKHFMAYVQTHYVDVREQAVNYLARAFYDYARPPLQRLQIHSGGQCHGNLQNPRDHNGLIVRACTPYNADKVESQRIVFVEEAHRRGHYLKNEEFFTNYRFTIAFENTSRGGYITEKLFNAFLSGSVPVYWGTTDVFKVFNHKAFVYYDMDHPEDAVEQIRYLEANPEAYQAMLNEPILANGRETVKQFLSLSERIEGGFLRRRIMEMMGYDPNITAGVASVEKK